MHRVRRNDSEVNVNPLERVASTVTGASLVVAGLRRRSLAGALLAFGGADLLYRGATGYCHLYGALRISTADGRRAPGAPDDAAEIRRSISVQRPRDDVYRHWRDPANVERVWAHFAEVDARAEGARWRVRTPLGRTLEWETRIVEEREGELVRWESLAGASVPNEGRAEFRDAPGEWGTEVTLVIRFDPPAGVVGDAATRLLDMAPKLVAEKALRRFKSLVEAGEIATTERNPTARES